MLKRKNGDEVVKQFSLTRAQLDVMEPDVCSVSTKLHFVTIFTDFCEAKISVCDYFRFGPKSIPMSFVFLLQKFAFTIGLAFLCISTKKFTGGFFVRYWQEQRLLVEK